jgi:hypothetical protein
MSFWNKLEKSFALIGSLAVTEMAVHEVDYKWFVVAGLVGFSAKLIHIWIEDTNGNNIADIAE